MQVLALDTPGGGLYIEFDLDCVMVYTGSLNATVRCHHLDDTQQFRAFASCVFDAVNTLAKAAGHEAPAALARSIKTRLFEARLLAGQTYRQGEPRPWETSR